jgi:hypothetical protein
MKLMRPPISNPRQGLSGEGGVRQYSVGQAGGIWLIAPGDAPQW